MVQGHIKEAPQLASDGADASGAVVGVGARRGGCWPGSSACSWLSLISQTHTPSWPTRSTRPDTLLIQRRSSPTLSAGCLSFHHHHRHHPHHPYTSYRPSAPSGSIILTYLHAASRIRKHGTDRLRLLELDRNPPHNPESAWRTALRRFIANPLDTPTPAVDCSWRPHSSSIPRARHIPRPRCPATHSSTCSTTGTSPPDRSRPPGSLDRHLPGSRPGRRATHYHHRSSYTTLV